MVKKKPVDITEAVEPQVTEATVETVESETPETTEVAPLEVTAPLEVAVKDPEFVSVKVNAGTLKAKEGTFERGSTFQTTRARAERFGEAVTIS